MFAHKLIAAMTMRIIRNGMKKQAHLMILDIRMFVLTSFSSFLEQATQAENSSAPRTLPLSSLETTSLE